LDLSENIFAECLFNATEHVFSTGHGDDECDRRWIDGQQSGQRRLLPISCNAPQAVRIVLRRERRAPANGDFRHVSG
jgi:hypothetical protein